MRKLRNKINWVLLPYFIIFLILVFLQNVCNIRFPDILYNETLSIILIISWMVTVFILLLLNVVIPIGRIGYKKRFWGKRTIEKILNMDKRKKKIIDIICWVLMAIDIIIMIIFKLIIKEMPSAIVVLREFLGIPWWYQTMFNFAYPVCRGDYDKYLY